MIPPARHRLLLVAIIVAAIAAGGTALGVAATESSNGHFDLRTMNGPAGPMVVTGTGLAVYIYLPDPTHPSATTCTADCVNDWPPVLAPAGRLRLSGIEPWRVSVLVRPDHQRQLTLAGYPLYRFAGDHRAGQTFGESIGDTWFAIGPDGTFVTLAPVTFEGSAQSSADLHVVSTSAGPVVADSAGQSLYTYKDDRPNRSACLASWCLQDWPPLVVQRRVDRIEGITAPLGALERPEGSLQLTLGGHPLYRFAGDTQTGDVRGLGVGGDWYPIAPDGTKVSLTESQFQRAPNRVLSPVNGDTAHQLAG